MLAKHVTQHEAMLDQDDVCPVLCSGLHDLNHVRSLKPEVNYGNVLLHRVMSQV